MSRLHQWLPGLLVAISLASACTDVDLVPVPRPPPVLDDRLTVAGSFCTDPPQPADFPVRVLFIVDVSQSMNVTDPAPPACTMQACFTRRGQAVLDVMGSNPAGAGVAYGLITFASGSSILTKNKDGRDGFTEDGDTVKTKLPLLNQGNSETNYEGALQAAFQMLQADMIGLGTTARSRARYIVVFLSDGMPAPVSDNFNTPARIRDKVAAIKKLERDQRLAEVTFHAAYLAGPDTPVPVQVVAKDLLDGMARTGGGTFRTFQAAEKIRFFYIDFHSFIRSFSLKSFLASDDNSRPRAGLSFPDSDGDGLLDTDEIAFGTDPRARDTDGDGFGDQLEVRLRNAGFDPLYKGDADCPIADDKRDADGDGLTNCEERFIGTDAHLIDTDADGLPDDVEYRLGSNPVVADDLVDTDFDGARNGVEVPAHTDPTKDDTAELSKIAYRYQIKQRDPDPSMPGRQCFAFEVSNITLTPTLDANGLPAGTNTILLRALAAPLDSPGDYGTPRLACVRPNYRQGPEVKRPPSGRMQLETLDFKKPAGDPDDPAVFNADRDCLVP